MHRIPKKSDKPLNDPRSFEARCTRVFKGAYNQYYDLEHPSKYFEKKKDWKELGALMVMSISKAEKVEQLEKELAEEKKKNGEITQQLAEKDAKIEHLMTVLKSNYHYQENQELKDTVSELETDLKWYKEQEDRQRLFERFQKESDLIMEAFKELDIQNMDEIQERSKNLEAMCGQFLKTPGAKKAEGVKIPDESEYREEDSDGDWDLVEGHHDDQLD